jgi:hypothetical protein
MTTYSLVGYFIRRDADGAPIDKFDMTTAASADLAVIRFVSADNQRSAIGLAAQGGLTDVVFTNVIDMTLDGTSVFTSGGTLQEPLVSYIAEVVYQDGVTKDLTEFGIWEPGGERSWFFVLGGDIPSYGLNGLGDIREYESSITGLEVPGAPFAPGSNIFIDTIATARVTEDDFFGGTSANDVVNLGIGNDTIRGANGNDELYGDEGRDDLLGENGNDMLSGGAGADLLIGGAGDDTLLGGSQNDTLLGGDGNDALRGNDGNDSLDGSDGADTIDGGTGNDSISGGEGLVGARELKLVLDNFGPGPDAGGWNSQNATPRALGDIDGDGAADIVGFGGPQTFSSLNDGTGAFAGVQSAVGNFAQAQGWKTQDGQLRLLGDVDGDGDDDIIGFGFNKGFSSTSQGDGTFVGLRGAVDNFANAQGWRSNNDTPRIMADVNGDGVDDIVGFGFRGTLVSLGKGDGTYAGAKLGIANFGTDQAWTSNDAFLRLAGDVNGDGLDDIVGFGINSTFTALSNGDGTFGNFRSAIQNFAQKQGWKSNDATPRAVGDVNGDGIADIVGFGSAKTFTALGRGDGTFGAVEVLTNDFSRDAGWTSQDKLLRQVADVDGDGDDDLVGFSSRGVFTLQVGPEGDTFVFKTGDGNDIIEDFDVLDVLDMRGTGLSAGQALAAAVQQGDDVLIEYGNSSILLEDYVRADLELSNFL